MNSLLKHLTLQTVGCLSFGVFFFLAFIRADTTHVDKFFDTLRKQFSVGSIDITGVYAISCFEPPGNNPVEKVNIHFREQGDRTWFEFEQGDGSNQFLPVPCIVAFNGTQGQFLQQSQKLLKLQKGQFKDSTLAGMFFNPLSEFIPFFPILKTQKIGYLTRFTDFDDQTAWKKTWSTFLPITNNSWGNNNLVAFSGTSIGEMGSQLYLKFGLDPNFNYAPVVWERWQGNQRRVKFKVVEMGRFSNNNSGFPLYFPRKTQLILFKPDGISPSLQIDFEVSSLALGAKYTDEDFTIDPSLANTIYDSDNDKWIQVPR